MLLSGSAGTFVDPTGENGAAAAAPPRRSAAPAGAHASNRRGRTAPRQMFIQIAGKVFGDADGDGRRDRGEGPLAGVVVYCDTVNGPSEPPISDTALNRTTTAADGSYLLSFAGPPSVVHVVPPAGLHPPAGDDGARPVGSVSRLGITVHVRPIALTRAAGIVGTVYRDVNGDGESDGDSVGVRGVRVFLDANADGVRGRGEAAARSNRLGKFHFGSLGAGTYRVVVIPGRRHRVTAPADGAEEVTVPDGTVVGVIFRLQKI